jgi:glutathione synthase/RimK-type ligase-like ATP-grasp enzyme
MILTTLLASLALLTSGNYNELKEDDNLLIKALQKQQIDARSVIWDDPQNNWKDYQAMLVFSTWDYHTDKFNFFLQTLSEIEKQGIPLLNPLGTIRWNASKVYLKKLAEKGVKVIDSIYLSSKDLKNLPNLLEKYG